MILYNRIKKIFLNYFSIYNQNLIKKTSSIYEFTNNSMDIIELFMILEKEFKVEFSDDIISKFTTIKLIINFINSKK